MVRKTGKNVGEETHPNVKVKITELLFIEYLQGFMEVLFDFGLRKVLCEA